MRTAGWRFCYPAQEQRKPLRAPAAEAAEWVSDFVSIIRNLILDVRDSYRPGVYYMRGPGPKWHAERRPSGYDAYKKRRLSIRTGTC